MTEAREGRWKEIDGNTVRETLFTRYDNEEQYRKAHEKTTLLQKSLNSMKKLNYKEMY